MGIGPALQIIFRNGHWEEILICIKSYRTGRIGSVGRAFTYVKHSYFFSIMFASFHHKDTLKVSHILLYL
jgi:hypothetical protein